MNLTLGDIEKISGVHNKNMTCEKMQGVSTDSRDLKKGMLFIALRGDNYDGHNYLEEVFKKGACGAVVDRKWSKSRAGIDKWCIFPVADTHRVLQEVAAFYRNRFSVPVLSVTGSNGKTSTKEMISAVLGTKYRVMKTPGNYNNHIGVPLSVFSWDEKGEIAVVEMGTNHFGEIRRLCEIAQPTHGLITNVGKGHLEFFKTVKGVSKAKAELLDYLKDADGVAFLNGDDPLLFPLRKRVKKTVTYGFSEKCDFRARNLGANIEGLFSMVVDDTVIRVPIPGQYNLYNALAAISIGRTFHISWQEIKGALESYRSMEKRMEMVNLPDLFILNDTYNANPTSVYCALVTLRDIQKGTRKVAVLGDMLELGTESSYEHEKVGQVVCNLGLDLFFSYGPEMKKAADSAKGLGFENVYHFESQKDLVEKLFHIIRQGDVILVKGSRAMKMENIVEELKSKFPEKLQE